MVLMASSKEQPDECCATNTRSRNSSSGMTCSLEYSSIGCNRTPQALDWGNNGLVAFGASLSVVLYKPKRDEGAGKIVSFLNGHSDRVNCVQWIKGYSTNNAKLVSGSTDKTVCVWKELNGKWTLLQQLKGHSNAVCAVSAISLDTGNGSNNKKRTFIASAGADSMLNIWQSKEDEEFIFSQHLTFGKGFVLCVAFAVFPSTKVPVLACGCDDSNVHIYIEDKNQFIKAQTLRGHEDWIRTLDFTCTDDEDTLFLASGSQDCFIRIWKIGPKNIDIIENDPYVALRLAEKEFAVTTEQGSLKEFSVVLDSVLAGHDGWVYGVKWKPLCPDENNHSNEKLCLLSASMDKTIILWQPDKESGVWLDQARMGEVGGNTLGLYGCACSPDGNAVLAHGYQGAFHLWKQTYNKEKISKTWELEVTISGHFGPVEDFDWDPESGQFVVSVSSDQTARLHAPWKRKDQELTWHEIGRPQIHGHDMKCIAMINRHTFASGAEEKVIRIFEAPGSFYDNLESICGVERDEKIIKMLPLGASIPPLGLSNKAVFKGDIDSWKDVDDPGRPMKASAFASEDPAPFKPMTISSPPPEDLLLQNTLWPEVQKLYGHGFEVFCLACNPQGTLLASSCKASKAEHANILLWDTSTWKQISSLSVHSLTVTNMAFSNSGMWLLSVSRDRTWALFKKTENENNYRLVQKTEKKTCVHTRIIWSCSWTHDDKYFLTGSRDKKVIIWGCNTSSVDDSWQPISQPLDAGESVMAVDAAPLQLNDKSYLIAVGVESGQIKLYSWLLSAEKSWKVLIELPGSICPTLAVKRLKWNTHQQVNCDSKDTKLQLAVCSSDSSLRILHISTSML